MDLGGGLPLSRSSWPTGAKLSIVGDCEQGPGELVDEQLAILTRQERRPGKRLVDRGLESCWAMDEEVAQQPSQCVESLVSLLLALGLAQPKRGSISPSKDDRPCRAVTRAPNVGPWRSWDRASTSCSSPRPCAAQLDDLAERLPVDERPLDGGDAADRIAWHVSRQVERALLDVSDEERVRVGVTVARALLDRLGELTEPDPAARPIEPAAVLRAVRRRNPDGSAAPMAVPLIPLLDTTLLTHASGEPTLWSQLQSEIESADAIDVVVAFIRRSGTRPLLDCLRRHCEAGRRLRVLTTTYTDSTERSAVDQLVDLGADVRISYDTSTTRAPCQSLGVPP